MAIDLHDFLHERLRENATLWAKDLRAHRADELTKKPEEAARSTADLAWETITTNRRLAARLRGEEPASAERFPRCPPEFAAVPALVEAIIASVDELLQAAGGDMEREVLYPGGSESVFAYALFAGTHMMYHLGQINYQQTLYGDPEMHWF